MQGTIGCGKQGRLEDRGYFLPFLNAKSHGDVSSLENEELSLGHFYLEIDLPSEDILVGVQILKSGKTSAHRHRCKQL